jgi:protein-tyrosine-phosphatase
MKKLIIFICNGNIERSVVAAECLKNTLRKKRMGSKFLVDSYGLQGTKGTALPKHKNLSEYKKEWKIAKPILEKFNINIKSHNFQQVTPDIIEKASVVVAMDKKVYLKNKNALLRQFPKHKNKIHLFSELTLDHKDIPDPAGSNIKYLHKKVIEKINTTLSHNYKSIIYWAE